MKITIAAFLALASAATALPMVDMLRPRGFSTSDHNTLYPRDAPQNSLPSFLFSGEDDPAWEEEDPGPPELRHSKRAEAPAPQETGPGGAPVPGSVDHWAAAALTPSGELVLDWEWRIRGRGPWDPEKLNKHDQDFISSCLGMTDGAAFDKYEALLESYARQVRLQSPCDKRAGQFLGPARSRLYRRQMFLQMKHRLEVLRGIPTGSRPDRDEAYWGQAENERLQFIKQAEEHKKHNKGAAKWYDPEIDGPKEKAKDVEETKETKDAAKGEAKEAKKAVKEAAKEAKGEVKEAKEEAKEAKNQAKKEEKDAKEAAKETKEEGKEKAADSSKPENKVGDKAENNTEDKPKDNAQVQAQETPKARRDNKWPDHIYWIPNAWHLGHPREGPTAGNWDVLNGWIQQMVEWRQIAREEQDRFRRAGLILPDPPHIPAGQDWQAIIRWRESAIKWNKNAIFRAEEHTLRSEKKKLISYADKPERYYFVNPSKFAPERGFKNKRPEGPMSKEDWTFDVQFLPFDKTGTF